MIELPDDPAPNGVEVEAVDFGATLRPEGGASPLRINRPGGRTIARVTYPPMDASTALVFMRRFRAATREGLRVEYPLLGVSQSGAGSPVVDGADPTGTTLPLRGLTPGYPIREGMPLNVVDGDGNRYLHFAGNAGRADASGDFTITDLEPPIRGEFADGDEVILAKPTIDGLLVEWGGYALSLDRLVRGAVVVIEEAAGLSAELGM